jgi:hypothetical protein
MQQRCLPVPHQLECCLEVNWSIDIQVNTATERYALELELEFQGQGIPGNSRESVLISVSVASTAISKLSAELENSSSLYSA